jgi:hypothetical protein
MTTKSKARAELKRENDPFYPAADLFDAIVKSQRAELGRLPTDEEIAEEWDGWLDTMMCAYGEDGKLWAEANDK